MRPESLYPLFRPVTALKGAGPRIAGLLVNLGVERAGDLLWLLPTNIIDRSYRPPLDEAEPGRIVTAEVVVQEHRPAAHKRQPYQIFVTDGHAMVTLSFFHARGDYLKRSYPVGEKRLISGKLERYGDRLQIVHPDFSVPTEDPDAIPESEPVYPLTAGLAGKTMRALVHQMVDGLPELPEWQDETLKSQQKFPGWRDALQTAHNPHGASALLATTPARRRLAYDELLSNQLALFLVRHKQRRQSGLIITGDGTLIEKARRALPYVLTGDQEQAVTDILADMQGGERMLRLVQGDVGSGKTIVAFFALLRSVEAGYQGAYMAPTEVLARQHEQNLVPMAEACGIVLRCLTGRDKGAARQQILDDLAAGKIDILVGTHAIFQESVEFHRLGLAVVDEQHRFGVHQRMMLADKGGRAADMLVMTATPIPRTLSMTAYGDMDVTRIREKPPGRKPVDTRAISLGRLPDIISGLGRQLAGGERIYWICPLVEETETSESPAAAESRYRELAQSFGDQVGLVHGRMPAQEKEEALNRFARGETTLLVATTVVEVGVDVPEASVIVIEEAERFGLAQLHQLRGRVGRGGRAGTCLLLYRSPLSQTARKRLDTLRQTEDGFLIAEEDFQQRGAGELLGTRQSGLPSFKLADLEVHADLLEIARDEARLIVSQDPELTGERGNALRTLLYLFERDAAIRYLRSG